MLVYGVVICGGFHIVQTVDLQMAVMFQPCTPAAIYPQEFCGIHEICLHWWDSKSDPSVLQSVTNICNERAIRNENYFSGLYVGKSECEFPTQEKYHRETGNIISNG